MFVIQCRALTLSAQATVKKTTVQWKYPPEIEQRVSRILNFEEPVPISFSNISANKYVKPVDIIPESLQLVLTSFLIGTKEIIQQADKRNEELFSQLESIRNRSAEWYFVYIRLLMNRTILKASQESYFQSVYSFYKTVTAISEAIEKFPSFAPLHTIGKINNQIYGLLTDFDPKIRYLLPSPLSIDEGLRVQYWSTAETPLWLSISLMVSSGNNDTVNIPTTYASQAEKVLVVSALLSNKNSETVLSILARDGNSPMDFFYKGWALLTIGKYSEAEREFKNHLSLSKPYIHKRAAILGLYYIDVIANNGANCKALLESMENYPSTIAYRDQVAQREIQKEHHPILLKARLLSDANQWGKALEVLQAFNPDGVPANFKIEFYYRQGRSQFFLKKYNEALAAYSTVLSPKLPDVSYFKAQAAFDRGKIYEELRQREKAKAAYSQSIELAKKSKRPDIERSARIALNRL